MIGWRLAAGGWRLAAGGWRGRALLAYRWTAGSTAAATPWPLRDREDRTSIEGQGGAVIGASCVPAPWRGIARSIGHGISRHQPHAGKSGYRRDPDHDKPQREAVGLRGVLGILNGIIAVSGRCNRGC